MLEVNTCGYAFFAQSHVLSKTLVLATDIARAKFYNVCVKMNNCPMIIY